MIQIISLLGKAGSGKTTTANHLRDKYGAKIVSLAAPLKKIAKVVMDFSDEQLYGDQSVKEAIDPRYGMSARTFLQKLGTEGIRTHLGGDVWLQALVFNMLSDELETVFVVDDARFVNEIEFLRSHPKLATTVIKLVCTDAPPTANDEHPSEKQIDLVSPSAIDAVVISSRVGGMTHLIDGVENALDKSHLRTVRAALQAKRRAIAERDLSEAWHVKGAIVEPKWFESSGPLPTEAA